MTLAEEGYGVQICTAGREGLKEIRSNSHDILLLDMKLPDIDGMEILKAVRQERPDLLVIIMTGYSTVRNAVDAMKIGAFDYLAKPFPEDELILAVSRAAEKKRLVDENRSLRQALAARFDFDNIIGENPNMLKVFEEIQKVAPTDSTVLLFGESGTGKELFARAIHAHSARATRQFVAVDCSTLTPSLLESELFGHVKGAFTGAVENKAGIFEVANRGTLFLDDIANISLETQGKLLRVLEMKEYKPVGASQVKKTDARVIAATNRDLKQLVEEGGFREDLFYRLNVFPIYLPPLRNRKDDIPKLSYHFLRHFCRKTGKRINGFSEEALEMLIHYDWPGNVRQLKNIIERLVIMADRMTLDLIYLVDQLQKKRFPIGDAVPETMEQLKATKQHFMEENFRQIEKAFLIKALKACEGNITRAAERVGMQRSNFHALLRKHGIIPKTIATG